MSNTQYLDINGRTLKVGHIVKLACHASLTYMVDSMEDGRVGMTTAPLGNFNIKIYRPSNNVRKLEPEELI